MYGSGKHNHALVAFLSCILGRYGACKHLGCSELPVPDVMVVVGTPLHNFCALLVSRIISVHPSVFGNKRTKVKGEIMRTTGRKKRTSTMGGAMQIKGHW